MDKRVIGGLADHSIFLWIRAAEAMHLPTMQLQIATSPGRIHITEIREGPFPRDH